MRSFALANLATTQLGTNGRPAGLAIVVADGPSFTRPALYLLNGLSNAVSEVSDPDAGWSPTLPHEFAKLNGYDIQQ